ncbi:TRAP transporter large permease subunit [Herbaspirillum lusitanum]|jgi:tripartite ATP-independent transporter DctM subunit|uniref:TRAP transporter large permease subunit n=1 Tax=Herbaspirillum lusitanum TaxID=213312 RepID=A0ABW9AAS0_9BURK
MHTLEATPVPQASTSPMAVFGKLLQKFSEICAAVLVLIEIGVLIAGTTARYFFGHPLTWTDELASMLFLWLAMFGSVIALRHGSHMRLTTFINKMPPAVRGWVEVFGMVLAATFLIFILMPSYEQFEESLIVTTPTLEINEGFRVGAILVGVVLMLLTALERMFTVATLRQLAGTIGLVVVIGTGLWLNADHFAELGNVNLIIFFVTIVLGCVVLGVPIAFAFGLATLSYLAFATDTPLSILPNRMNEGMSPLILLAVPLFVFLGSLIEMVGLARAMIGFLVALIGHVRGGLQYVLLGAMYLVSGISGAKVADMAAVAPALFPEMKKRGTSDGDLIGLLSASGAMSETIPPSLVLIAIGSVTGVSIASLFVGGLFPAIVGMLCMCVVVYFQTKNEKMDGVERAPGRLVWKAFFVALPAIALPFVIRTAVVEGVATATEVSTIGIVYTIIVGPLVYRQFDLRRIYPMLIETASLSGAILLIIGCATGMSWALTQSGFSHQLVEAMSTVPGGKLGFLAISALAFIVLGSVLEGIPAIVLFGPLMFPIARVMGINEVHYAMIAIFSMGLGLFAPPFGVGFYAACAVGRVAPDKAIGHVWPHIAALFFALILLILFPWISIGFL